MAVGRLAKEARLAAWCGLHRGWSPRMAERSAARRLRAAFLSLKTRHICRALQTEVEEWNRSIESDGWSLDALKALFKRADQNLDGVVDLPELKTLLQSTDHGFRSYTVDWLSDAEALKVMRKYDENESGGISFEEFSRLVKDGALLDGKLEEYEQAFKAVDTTGNGYIGASEINQLFSNLGHPLRPQKLFGVMEQYDVDGRGQISFPQFLRMFHSDLLDLSEMLSYIRMNPTRAAPSKPKLINARFGEITMLFSEAELDALLGEHHQRLVCVEASLTWCRPCKGFERAYLKFAEFYERVLFLKFFGNSNESTKRMMDIRLKVLETPTFTFFREGAVLHSYSGANVANCEDALQQLTTPEENPLNGSSPFKRQVWHAKLGLV